MRNLPKVPKTVALEQKQLPEKERRQLRRIQEEKERAEKERRELEAAAAPAPVATTSTPAPATSPGPAGHAAPRAFHPAGMNGETPLEAWQRKRRQTGNLSAG